MSINWRASLVPAAAVIPAPIAYIKVVVVWWYTAYYGFSTVQNILIVFYEWHFASTKKITMCLGCLVLPVACGLVYVEYKNWDEISNTSNMLLAIIILFNIVVGMCLGIFQFTAEEMMVMSGKPQAVEDQENRIALLQEGTAEE
eukprot:NODE_21081_length_769_cov_811.658879.p2 GENE.NODE_21081_length_769_cov_811.658879~~NODE_21081_length_769_cov_811.658879.p2  ORF type:complete len:144 (-),score=29.75 NODE_21081_length_769_cov_811.658879:248-679(-)